MSNAGEGDKRSVTTDALQTLGTIITPNEKRDAIHLAVENVVAGGALLPGQHVEMRDGVARAALVGKGIGIVDPFLPEFVKPGERFWLVIYPRMIHSLRHVWTHPAFADEPEVAGMAPKLGSDAKAASEAWLRDWCKVVDGVDYATLIATATDGSTKDDEDDYGDARSTSIEDDYFMVYGSHAHGEIPPEVWDHVEIVTGRKVVGRPSHFSCSC